MPCRVTHVRYEPFVCHIESFFNTEDAEVLFHKRNTLKSIEWHNETYVVKSFKVPHLLNQFVYKFFRKSKAQRSYENATKLEKLEILTAKPIGYLESPHPFFFKKSYFVSTLFAHDFEIRAVLENKHFPQREALLKAFITFTYTLHNKGVFHIDYSPGNILVKVENDAYHFGLVDVNRMKFLSLNLEQRMQNLAKLTFDEEDNRLFTENYAILMSEDPNTLWKTLQHYLTKQKKYLERKKRLKALRDAH
jgi:hypothetical protein